jgi:lipopolysaccharide biosynthesis glycosyltransferase
MRWTFVTCADQKYFPLLQGMVMSIVDRSAEARQAIPDIHVLDIGLAEGQREWLRRYVKGFVVPGWDVSAEDAAFLEANSADALKGLTARPHLPRYVPGYDLYFWLDADAWVQRWDVIDWHLRAAEGGRMAVTPGVHRAWASTFHSEAGQQAIFDMHLLCVEERLARALVYQLQQINAGVFALEAKSPVWTMWADCINEVLTRMRAKGRVTGLFEQIALNTAIYTRRAPVHFMPAICNWLMNKEQATFDTERKMFVEPLIPFEAIGIVHVTHSAIGHAGAKLSPIKVVSQDRKRTFMTPIDYLSVRKNLLGLTDEL